MNSKQAILLVSWAGTIHLAKELLETSLKDYNRDIVVVINDIAAVKDEETLSWLMNCGHKVFPVEGNRWEMGGLEAMIVFTGYEEFILIQDTLEIKDTKIFDIMFDEYPGRSVAFGKDWACYLGKYRRQILMQFPLPPVLNKMDAFYWEQVLPMAYEGVAKQLEGHELAVLFPEWHNKNPNNYYDEKFGRTNIVLDNPYLIKRKSVEWPGPFNIRARVFHGDE
jgi:hypothetical protein